jgi:hypothetical protein
MTWNKYLGIEVRFVSLLFLVADVIGILLFPDVRIKVGLGYVALLILSACFILGTITAWAEDKKDTMELVSLRTSQRQNTRDCIYPILSRVWWHLDDVKGDLDLTLAFVSTLVDEIKISNVKGILHIYGVASHEFDFSSAPPRLLKATRTNGIRESIRFPEVMKREIKKKMENKEKLNGKLAIKMSTDRTDPITFDPSDEVMSTFLLKL